MLSIKHSNVWYHNSIMLASNCMRRSFGTASKFIRNDAVFFFVCLYVFEPLGVQPPSFTGGFPNHHYFSNFSRDLSRACINDQPQVPPPKGRPFLQVRPKSAFGFFHQYIDATNPKPDLS